jgi:ppGpp synthetase/RelA/SpoT-type nucleotidyltranferase
VTTPIGQSKVTLLPSVFQRPEHGRNTLAYPSPPKPKADVKRAGEAYSNGQATEADLQRIDQWRASHGYVINTFQAWIKGHINRRPYSVEFAQRLKRRRTVLDKLQRRDNFGNLLIGDVSSMHDFAGCRMIFDDIEDLRDFRKYMHSSAITRNVQHQLRHDPEKYDYIEHPKSSGYRGIHDVYKHFPRGSDRMEKEPKPWDGLLVEIQYRTRAQHAWATAVEISDLFDGERTKFEMNISERGEFFAIASEIIARRHEGLSKVFIDFKTEELQARLQELENKLGIMQRLDLLKQFEDEEKLQQHNVLNIFRDKQGDLALEVIPFKSAAPAIAKATELEEDGDSINAVYVRADNPKQLRSAYRNYFNDPVDFVQLLREEAALRS